MKVYNNYKEYRKYLPQYKEWKEQRNADEAKREAYIKQNGVDGAQRQEDIKRAEAVLNAIDIMDEYSQSRAENTELATQAIQTTVAQISSFAGMALGIGLMCLKPVNKVLTNLGKNTGMGNFAQALPMILGPFLGLVFLPGLIAWSNSKEVDASRAGRYEAMKKDLSSINQFAVLNDKQIKERDDRAKEIVIPKDEKNKNVQGVVGGIPGLFKAIKEFAVVDKEYVEQRKEFNKKIEDDRAKFDKVPLTPVDIIKAKKDKQLIGNAVEKIDTASQDYAENVEFATNIINTVSLSGGGLLGLGTDKILKNVNFKNVYTSKIIGGVVGSAFAIALSAAALKLQKQASRVARFKVKQDFKEHPEKHIYVDDDKIKDVKDFDIKEEKKQNIFKFLLQAFRDNKEYNLYLKDKGIEEKKKRKALDKIELTEEQKKNAKALQTNVFKTFNEIDEKSQKYSESTEAVGQIVQEFGSLALTGLAFLVAGLLGKKSFKALFSASTDAQANKSGGKALKSMIGVMATTMVPIVALDAYVTSEQKKASRVANMLGLEELKDHRNFVDYTSSSKENTSDIKNTPLTKNTQPKEEEKQNLTKDESPKQETSTSSLFEKFEMNAVFNKFSK